MHEFPLVLKHRSDPHASIVVMNADQLNAVPDEFAPDEVRKARAEGGADVGVTTAEKSISGDNSGTAQHAEDLDKREAAFNKAVDDFTDSVKKQSQKLQEDRAYVERERAELEELRKGLEQQDQQLQRDRAAFEAEKNDPANGALKEGEVTGAGGVVEQAPVDGDKQPTTPAKRSRSKE